MLDMIWNVTKTSATVFGFVVGFLILGKDYKLVRETKDKDGTPLCCHEYGCCSNH